MTSAIDGPRNAMARRALPRIVLVACALSALSCASYIEVPVETPLQSKLDVNRFKRLLIGGFVTDLGEGLIDTQAETVRLLQNHLRANSRWRVLEPDQPPLEDALDAIERRLGDAARASKAGRDQNQTEAERTMQDPEFWRRVGEEYQQPLIVTGHIGFESHERSGYEAQQQIGTDPQGQMYRTGRGQYMERRGYTLTAEFLFVDGRDGQTLHKEKFTEEVLYPQEHKISPLAAYFELMDRLLPNVLGVVSTQRIRGTRVLIQ
jgi:hypothetical protein